jgi:hypothetical protein
MCRKNQLHRQAGYFEIGKWRFKLGAGSLNFFKNRSV